MSKRLVLVVAVVGMVGMVVGASIAVGQGGSSDDTLTARMSGNQERPAGDPDGKGAAGVVVDGRKVCLSIAFAGLDTVAAAHIHRGARGQNGDIVVDPKFSGGRSGSANTLARCVTVAQDVAQGIKRNPANYYVNVHTTKYPAGAIRGQLSRR
ncbi:MAG: hypothetical protein QOF29_1247 [bacterium]|jgi:hypothetical protein|nr:hypothetical protein [Solirubrobacteraceae bacterium]